MSNDHLPIKFWFVCKGKECKQGFQKIDDFLEHKKEKHWTEFQTTTCILFEERHLCHVPFLVRNLDPEQLTVNETILMPETPPSYFAESDRAVKYYGSSIANGNGSSVTTDFPAGNNNIIGNNEEIIESPVTTIGQGDRMEHNNYETEPKPELVVCEKVGQSIVNSAVCYRNRNQLVAFSSTTQTPRKCRLCKKQPLNSEWELRIHLEGCILNHKNRRRFCLPCNRLYPSVSELKKHQLRIHGIAISVNKERQEQSHPRKNPLVSKISTRNPSEIEQVTVNSAPAQRRPARPRKKPPVKSVPLTRAIRIGLVLREPKKSNKPVDVAEERLSPRTTSTSTVVQDSLTSESENHSKNHSHQIPWKCSAPATSNHPPKSSSSISYGDFFNDHLYNSFDLTNLKASEITSQSEVGRNEFICSICKAFFKSRKHCLYHALSHTGEKPFTCKLCHKSYTQHYNLSVHLEKDHVM